MLRFLFTAILLLSAYHLFRDTLQILNINNILANLWNRPHLWCGSYCDYVTYPLEIFQIAGSYLVLKRKKVGLLGILIIVSLPLWLLAAFLP